MNAIETSNDRVNARQSKPIRVMLVDDSLVARSILERILSSKTGIEVICQAADAYTALDMLKEQQVDIILLDIEMPKLNGLDALPKLLEKSAGARVIVVSSFAEYNGPAAVQALSLGACDTLAKPGRSGFTGRFSETLINKVVKLGRTKRGAIEASPESKIRQDLTHIDLAIPHCIAIGASTGGIPAIHEIIKNLHANIACPIFITQHLPGAFMTFFAKQLGGQTKRIVEVASEGMIVKQNHIYVAPGEGHLLCKNTKQGITIIANHEYVGNRYCPSVDAMFESIAEVYGNKTIAIILSGMGNDGTAGARMLKKSGATLFVQDSGSSVVWGMPGAAVRENLTDYVLRPEEIAQTISMAVAS
jgi:two-component system, chemotaxis family, protein-glutamate methylesterase/glutaminase